uniref:Uncharacterized protein n=1 Tax=Timema cristinae TaxID=61476 RepID=A0A7R9H2Y8_TIMCR|nr:unnamed protein product [Timema cristinae]
MSSWDASRRRSSQPSSSRLRMDSYSAAGRASRARAVSPKRRELDTVMKKARRDGPNQSNYWNKKLLEVEEKDPNRWRHSGFKELYGGGASSPVGSRSSHKRSSRSRSRSRGPARQSRTRARSPPAASRPRSRERSRERERERERRPHTPVTQPQRVQSQPSQRTSRPVVGRRSPRILSLSASSRSLSSCSDESCSVCSPKGKAPKKPPSPVARPRYRTPRSRSTKQPVGSGHSSLPEDLLWFKTLQYKPIDLNMERLDDGHGTKFTLKAHKKCRLKFNQKVFENQTVHSLQSLLALSEMVLLALQTYMVDASMKCSLWATLCQDLGLSGRGRTNVGESDSGLVHWERRELPIHA